ncbi:MAG: competence/damage-inducible protein A [Bacillota bacterium]|nr:competence/damage-inducible protein A [Bacillota bacterium]
MNVSIIAVGTELLFGQTINTNAAYLSERMNLMGFNIMYHFVVGDNPGRLKMTLEEAFSKSDIAVITGGLGPTQDDLTKETVAEFMGASLLRNDRVLEELESFFKRYDLPMSENNRKQAYLPEGCVTFYNEAGTAPGFALERDGRVAICLPGPPREMTWLFENGVKQYLERFLDREMFYRVIRTIGIGESDLETLLLPLIDGQTDPTIATYAKEGECSIRVASQRDSLDDARAAVDEMTKRVCELCGDFVYSTDDAELKEVVVELLKEKGLTIASAESCTGGKFAAAITDVAGSSKVYGAGYVTYSIDAKVNELGVDRALIAKDGVVSSSVAEQMAIRAREKAGSDIAISITGYAGPDADEGFSAGDAFIGYACADKSGFVEMHRNRRSRKWNRDGFTLAMLRVAYLLLNGRL